MTDKALAILDDIVIGSARGRKAKPLALEVMRELQESDLDLILNPPPSGIQASPVQRMRNTHHMLARLLAEGRKGAECSLITGYTPGRISVLQSDPTFKELVEYYKDQAAAKFVDVHARLAALAISSLDELQERLEAEPEGFTKRELMELAELCLDRSIAVGGSGGGLPPGGAAGISIAIKFVGAAKVAPPDHSGPTIDGTAVRVS